MGQQSRTSMHGSYIGSLGLGEPVASIVIVNYNGERFIEKLFKTIIEQDASGRVPFEVVFIDNASRDGSVGVALSFREEMEKNGIKLRIYKSRRNLGFIGGSNLGARLSRGRYIVFLNNDTYLDKKWLSGLLKCVEAGGEVGVCQSILYNFDGSIQCLGHYSDFLAWIIDAKELGTPKLTLLAGVPVIKVHAASGASMIIEKRLFHRIGGFIRLFYGDYELSFAARSLGRLVVSTPLSKCYHYGSATVSKISVQRKLKYAVIEMLATASIYSHAPLAPLKILASILVYTLYTILLSIKYRVNLVRVLLEGAYLYLTRYYKLALERRSRLRSLGAKLPVEFMWKSVFALLKLRSRGAPGVKKKLKQP